MSALRFCMATTFYPPFHFGGDGVAVQQLARALVRAGHDVTVVHDVDAYRTVHGAPLPEVPEADEIDDAGVRVIRLQSRIPRLSSLLVHQLGRPVLHARRLRRLLADPALDVVHFHNVSLLGGPGLLRYPQGAVTLYTAHEHWLVCPTHVLWRHRRERCESRQCLRCVVAYRRPPQVWRYTGAIPRALRYVDVVLAMSEFSRERHRAYGLTRDMAVLPGFLDAAARDPEPIASPHPAPFFFFAGRLERMKGLDDVLDAFRRFADADLVIAGEGSEGARLRAAAADMPHVHFVGELPRERVRAFQRHAVAVLAPSIGYETFGLVLIEAFGAGTPVIARRIGPAIDIVEKSGAGELFSTAEDLHAALHRLRYDTAHRDRLAARAAEAARDRYSETVVLPQYLDLVRHAAVRRGHQRILAALGPQDQACAAS